MRTSTSQLMSPTQAKRPLPSVWARVSVVVSCSFVMRRGKAGAQPAPCRSSDRYGAIYGSDNEYLVIGSADGA